MANKIVESSIIEADGIYSKLVRTVAIRVSLLKND